MTKTKMAVKAVKGLIKAYTYLKRGHRSDDTQTVTYLECAGVIALLRGYDATLPNAYSMEDFRAETQQLMRDAVAFEVASDSNVDESVRREMENALLESEQ